MYPNSLTRCALPEREHKLLFFLLKTANCINRLTRGRLMDGSFWLQSVYSIYILESKYHLAQWDWLLKKPVLAYVICLVVGLVQMGLNHVPDRRSSPRGLVKTSDWLISEFLETASLSQFYLRGTNSTGITLHFVWLHVVRFVISHKSWVASCCNSSLDVSLVVHFSWARQLGRVRYTFGEEKSYWSCLQSDMLPESHTDQAGAEWNLRAGYVCVSVTESQAEETIWWHVWVDIHYSTMAFSLLPRLSSTSIHFKHLAEGAILTS